MSSSKRENSGLIDMASLVKQAEEAEKAESSAKLRALAPEPAASGTVLKGAPEPTSEPKAVAAAPPPASTKKSVVREDTDTPPPPPVRAVEPDLASTSPATPYVAVSATKPGTARSRLAYAALAVGVMVAIAVGLQARSTTLKPVVVVTPSTTEESKPVAKTADVAPLPATNETTPPGVDLAALPGATTAAIPAVKPPSFGGGRAAPRDEKKEEAVTAEAIPPSAGDPGDLGEAMGKSVDRMGGGAGIGSEATKDSNARQLRPSPGAVLGAITAALPSARACLSEDDPVRNGTITFKSDGSVARIDLDGSRPVDPCVKTALMKARVEPFLDETFAARLTVRP